MITKENDVLAVSALVTRPLIVDKYKQHPHPHEVTALRYGKVDISLRRISLCPNGRYPIIGALRKLSRKDFFDRGNEDLLVFETCKTSRAKCEKHGTCVWGIPVNCNGLYADHPTKAEMSDAKRRIKIRVAYPIEDTVVKQIPDLDHASRVWKYWAYAHEGNGKPYLVLCLCLSGFLSSIHEWSLYEESKYNLSHLRNIVKELRSFAKMYDKRHLDTGHLDSFNEAFKRVFGELNFETEIKLDIYDDIEESIKFLIGLSHKESEDNKRIGFRNLNEEEE